MIAARNAAKGGGQSEVVSAPPKDPNAVPFGMVKCPYCSRNFSEESGSRHIPACKNTKAKPTMLKKGTGGSAGTARLGKL
jgi:hypothetical protein